MGLGNGPPVDSQGIVQVAPGQWHRRKAPQQMQGPQLRPLPLSLGQQVDPGPIRQHRLELAQRVQQLQPVGNRARSPAHRVGVW
jgi:hypothetical protein